MARRMSGGCRDHKHREGAQQESDYAEDRRVMQKVQPVSAATARRPQAQRDAARAPDQVQHVPPRSASRRQGGHLGQAGAEGRPRAEAIATPAETVEADLTCLGHAPERIERLGPDHQERETEAPRSARSVPRGQGPPCQAQRIRRVARGQREAANCMST